MRTFLVLLLAVVVLAVVGWVSFSITGDRASVNVETEQIEQDTERMMESGQRLMDETGEALDRAVDDEPDQEPDDVDIDVDEEVVEPAPRDGTPSTPPVVDE